MWGRGYRDLHAAQSQFVVVELLQECLCYGILRRLAILPSFMIHVALSTTGPSSSIESANAEVKRVIETEESSDRRKRGHCEKFSPELRFQIGKHAAENGVAATMHFYAKKFVLKVRTLKLRMR